MLDKEQHINLNQIRAVDVYEIENRQGILEQQYLSPLQSAMPDSFPALGKEKTMAFI